MPLADLSTSSRKLPAPERLFVLVALMVSGTVTLPQVVEVGFMSGLGLWTLAAAGLSWGLWLMKPSAPRAILPAAVPLVAFAGFAAFTPLWGDRSGVEWIQLLAVTAALPGFLLLTAREAAARPGFGDAVLRALDFAAVTAAVGYTLTVLALGPGGDAEFGGRPVFLARPFALFAIVAVARQLGRYHAGDRGGMVVAAWLAALVFLSESRLGMVAVLAMFPASYALVGGRRNRVTAAVMVAAGAAGMTLLLTLSDAMYQRFFGYDASLEVGGVAINASGRTAAWTALLADIRTQIQLWFGSGAGAGSAFVTAHFANLPHPHNDYIRYLYDFGLFGLLWFLAFGLAAVAMLWRRLRAACRAAASGDPAARAAVGLPLGTLLAVAGVAASMVTDNPANYIYVMAPLGVLLGAALCRPFAQPEPDVGWVFAADDAPRPTDDSTPKGRAARNRAMVPHRAA
ncbi:MAG: O-antigen polymerase [Phycisphaerales bacterium]|nr:O-antigen polymerase [Phycisphaerales bacterium]